MRDRDDNNKKKYGSSFYNFLKIIFLLYIIIEFTPIIITSTKDYIQEATTPKTQVGTINIRGFIGNSSFYVKQIQRFLQNPKIKALLIKIDSAGGFPGTSQTIYNELKIFKKQKPVVAFIENMCTSGAYYVAAACNHIIAPPSSGIGGIGVLLNLPNIKEFLANWKIRLDHIQSGKYKTAGSPFTENTPEELQYLQKLSDEHYKQFVKDIALSRNLDKEAHKTWADGKMFIGNTALKLKLIDETGSHQNAINQIKKLAKITTKIKFITAPKPSGIMRFFSTEEEYETESFDFSSKVANTLSNIYNKFITKQMENKQSLVYG